MTLKVQALKIAQKLTRKRRTLALAESCTGGLISVHLTEIPGASKYFKGGLVSYANDAKRDLLGVSEKTLKKWGAVSEEVALQMARGTRKAFKSDWTVSVTGIAGPTGGSKEKPVGLVFFAVCGPNFEVTEKKNFKGNRKKIQTAASLEAMALLLKNLK